MLLTQNPCRADYNAAMTAPRHIPQPAALGGWRARVWAWVLFVALLKGLIPHAALASALMQGDPTLVWCAPGLPAVAGEGKAAGEMSSAAHACVCASTDEVTLLPGKVGPLPGGNTHESSQHANRTAVIAQRLLPPPARGPPAL